MPFEVLIPREQTLANIALVNPRTALSAFALISAAPTLMLSCHRLLRNSRVCSALSKIEEARRLEGACRKLPRWGTTVIRVH